MKRTDRPHFHLAVPAFLLWIGCGGAPKPPAEIGFEPRPAALVFYDEPAQVEVPDSVEAGVPFTVAATTYGDGCTEPERTDVQVVGLRADVRPWNLEAVEFPPNTGCTDNLVFIRHEAEVAFEEAGAGRIEIHGLSLPQQEQITVRRSVQVRP